MTRIMVCMSLDELDTGGNLINLSRYCYGMFRRYCFVCVIIRMRGACSVYRWIVN